MERFKVGDLADWVPGISGQLAFAVEPVEGVASVTLSLVGINVAVFASSDAAGRVLVAFASGQFEIDLSSRGGLLIEVDGDEVSARLRTAPNVLPYSEQESHTSLTPGLHVPAHLAKLQAHQVANTSRRAARLRGMRGEG
ncbi:MAG: hypothetical protein [Microvirus sp.]|nr:MAG: hypothetical protein [Microvirus sp.]